MWLNKNVAVLVTAVALIISTLVLTKRKANYVESLAILVLVVYVGVVVAITEFPFPISIQSNEVFGAGYNLVPFKSIVACWQQAIDFGMPGVFVRQVIGNVLLFVPLGVLLPRVLPMCQRLRGVLLLAACGSVAIELIQLLNGLRLGTLYRAPDVDDVFLNVLGAMLGYGAYRLACLFYRRWRAARPYLS